MPKVGTAYVSIRARLDKLEKDLEDGKKLTQKYGEQSAKAYSNAFKGIAGYLGLRELKRAFDGLFLDGIASAAKFEREVLRTQALIRSTGNAAGLTSKDLVDLANQLDLATLNDRDQILSAINAMQTFRSVSGDTFKRSIELSGDLAEVLGGDVRTQAIALGKALEDPVRGITALRRSGVSFTEAQKEQIKALVESGQQLKAQGMILDEISKQVGGAARGAAGGLSGKIDTLNFRWRELKETIANSKPVINTVNDAIIGLTQSIEKLSKVDPEQLKTALAVGFTGIIGGAIALKKYQEHLKTLKQDIYHLRKYGEFGAPVDTGPRFPELKKTVDSGDPKKTLLETEDVFGKVDQALNKYFSDLDKYDDYLGPAIERNIDLALSMDPVLSYIDAQEERLSKLNETIADYESRNFPDDIQKQFALEGIDYTPDADFEEMQKKAETTADAMKNAFIGWGSDLSRTLTDAVWESDISFGKIAESFGKMTTQIALQKQIIEPLFTSLVGATTTASTAHTGGMAGEGPKRRVPSSLFFGARRLHTGLYPDEFPAILQRGETVIPRGENGSRMPSAINMTFNVRNEAGPDIEVQRGRVIQKSVDQFVGELVIKRKLTSRNFRNSLGAM